MGCSHREAENEGAKRSEKKACGGGETGAKVKAGKMVRESSGGDNRWEGDNGENSTRKNREEQTSNNLTSSIPVRELSLLGLLQLCSALSLIPGLSNMPC